MRTPLVSVVVPTFDRPDSITQAVASIRAQTYRPLELVVVDDCSPEPIEAAVRDLDLSAFEGVNFLRHERNRGASAARTTGIEAADGAFVAFMDDDDQWVDRKLEMQVNALTEAGPSAGVAYTGMRIVDKSGATIRTHRPTESGDLTQTLLCRNVVGSYSTALVRIAAIEDVGPPDERFPSWQDMEWWIRLSRDWEFVAVPDPLAVITQDDDHTQISDDFEAMVRESYPLFLEKFRPLAAEYGRLFERKMRGWAAFRVGGYNALRTGNVRAGRRYLFRAVRWYPFEPTFWLYLGVSLGGQPGYRLATTVKRRLFDQA